MNKVRKYLAGAIMTLLVGAGLATVPVMAASAHTPAISVSCAGVVLHGENYDGSKANTWFVTLDGVTQSGTFGASLDKTIAVPQDGKTTTVGAQVADADQTPAYTQAYSGSVGPCGTPPLKSQPIVPLAFTDATCDAGATYTIPVLPEGLKYTLNPDGTRPTPGTYPLAAGQTVTIQEHSIFGYEPVEQTFTFTGADKKDCTTPAPPKDDTPPGDSTPKTDIGTPVSYTAPVATLAETGPLNPTQIVLFSIIIPALLAAGVLLTVLGYRRNRQFE